MDFSLSPGPSPAWNVTKYLPVRTGRRGKSFSAGSVSKDATASAASIGSGEIVTVYLPAVRSANIGPVGRSSSTSEESIMVALGSLLQWASANLAEPLTVEILAHQAKMSTRTFARRFHAATGSTPRQWLLPQRLNRAKDLLESTDLPIGQVSAHSGLGSAANLRQHFGAAIGTTPTEYRRAFHQGRLATSSAAGRRVPV